MTDLKMSFFVWQFRQHLAEYYEDLAAWLDTTKEMRMHDVFVNDAKRYGTNHYRGALGAIWAQRYLDLGANLVDTWSGFVPDEDLAVLRAQQEQGPQAMISAFGDLARSHRLSKMVRSAVRGTIGMGAIGVLIAVASLAYLPSMTIDVITQTVRVTPDELGPAGQRLHAIASAVDAYGMFFLVVLCCAAAAGVWSMKNWVGSTRDWFDRWIFAYKISHQARAMRLAMTLATLTKKTTSTMLTLKRSIELLQAGATTPVERWQLDRLLERMDSGQTDITVFDTGIFSKEMYWRLEDLSQGHSMAEAFDVMATAIEKQFVPRTLKYLAFWRWALLIASITVVLGLNVQNYTAISELEEVMMNTMK